MSCWQEDGPPLGVKRARKQAKVLATGPQFGDNGGGGEYNIWYHKCSNHGERREKRSMKVQAVTRCCTATDSGENKAAPGAHHCIYFAQGRCALGYDCKRKHAVPTEDDDLRLGVCLQTGSKMHYNAHTHIHGTKSNTHLRYAGNTEDVFGRERFADEREDMRGVGSFMKENKTLYVGGLAYSGGVDIVRDLLRKNFTEWGALE